MKTTIKLLHPLKYKKHAIHAIGICLLLLLLLVGCGGPVASNSTPTPTHGATPQPTQSVTETPGITPTVTATPTPGITSTATPSPTPTALPTATPTPTPQAGPCDTPPGVQPASSTEVDIGNTTRPLVALTFDAGGDVAPASTILAILNRRGVHASWFFTGAWAQQNPDIVRNVASGGYEIGNHTMTHPDLTTLSNAEVCNQLTQADQVISNLTGNTTRPYFRPPFGARNANVRQLAAQLGYRTVYWTIDTLDWQTQSTSDSIIQRIFSQLTNGSIILMHAGSASEAQTLDTVITMLQQKGYQLVTLSEILQGI